MVGVWPGISFVLLRGVFRVRFARIKRHVIGFTVVEGVQAVSDFPAVRHAVTVGVRVVDERPVLGLFERVRKSIAVGVQGLSRFSAFTEDVLFGSAFEVADAFVGLPESADSNEQRAENERRDDGDVCHLVVIHGHG